MRTTPDRDHVAHAADARGPARSVAVLPLPGKHHQRGRRPTNPLFGPILTNDGLTDRLARLTYRCSTISEATDRGSAVAETLEHVLAEAEGLCRDIRTELALQRQRRQARHPDRGTGDEGRHPR